MHEFQFKEPLFKGATRPATYLGIPIKPLLFLFLPVGFLSMVISVWMWVTLLPIYILMRLLLANDDKFFTELGAMAKFWHSTTGNTNSLYNSDKR